MEKEIHIDGDFPSGKGDCKFHCYPSCHPAQIGPDKKYGCIHNAFPQNRARDFCPIVQCEGDRKKCALKGKRIHKNYINGLKRRIKNAEKKIETWKQEIEYL